MQSIAFGTACWQRDVLIRMGAIFGMISPKMIKPATQQGRVLPQTVSPTRRSYSVSDSDDIREKRDSCLKGGRGRDKAGCTALLDGRANRGIIYGTIKAADPKDPNDHQRAR